MRSITIMNSKKIHFHCITCYIANVSNNQIGIDGSSRLLIFIYDHQHDEQFPLQQDHFLETVCADVELQMPVNLSHDTITRETEHIQRFYWHISISNCCNSFMTHCPLDKDPQDEGTAAALESTRFVMLLCACYECIQPLGGSCSLSLKKCLHLFRAKT